MTTHSTTPQPIRVGLISLGCAKNLVDGEIILGSLLQSGIEITNDAASADVVIVNTCSFIDAAQEESVDTILQSADLRAKNNPAQGLIVAGCLPQRFRSELPKLLPEVDAFIGIDQVAKAAEVVREIALRRRALAEQAKSSSQPELSKKQIVGRFAELEKQKPPQPQAPLVEINARPGYIADYATPRFRLTPAHFSYVRIADGCNHPCSFCIIPRIRGSHRSRPQADIVAEARQLLAQGVKELNLISQDSTYYGLDLRPRPAHGAASPEKFAAAARSGGADASSLSTLIRELNALPGNFWIRLLYTHPAHWTDELIDTIAECPKVARYIDIPLQHIDETMLERMRRETSRQYIVDLLAKIRARIPDIAIRTTFIVGFPGETEARFTELLQFIREARFERLGVFTYSQQDGTRAAKMENQVPLSVRKHRHKRAMAEQLKVARSIAASFVGKEITVLVEGKADPEALAKARVNSWEHKLIRSAGKQSDFQKSYLVARGEADAPDIDGRVYIDGELPIGQFARVKIVGHTDYDLIAQP